ncbi:uncharacterized protein LOC123868955 [Maniola jurtina]|uniref:uncharacterized protein LOC123868955 n=1 Tax=Maniola jurtina TaxID=191418 RepID=UPI001E68F0CE|nr:uncharacterized protein LOC123868955 [Maniola jurtina]
MKSKRGVYILLHKGFKFTKRSRSKLGTVWKCKASTSHQCNASLTTDPNLKILLSTGDHDHGKPVIESKPKNANCTDPILMKSDKRGVHVLLYKGFKFTKRSRSKLGVVWKCKASKLYQCNASVTTDANLKVVLSTGEHDHRKPAVESKPKRANSADLILNETNFADSYSNFKDPILIKNDKKGVYVLVYEGYQFTRRAKSKQGTVWKCISSKSDQCNVTMTTDPNLKIVSLIGSHDHSKPVIESKPKHVYFETP